MNAILIHYIRTVSVFVCVGWRASVHIVKTSLLMCTAVSFPCKNGMIVECVVVLTLCDGINSTFGRAEMERSKLIRVSLSERCSLLL